MTLNRHLTGLVAAAAFLAVPLAAQVVAYHDASSATHQAQFNNLSNSGYRMIALTIYGTPQNQQYAAVWVHRAGPGFVGFHDKTSAEYNALVAQYSGTHAPRIVTACGSGNDARFAGVLEVANHAVWARHGLTAQDLAGEVKLVDDAHWRIATIDAYGSAQDPRYIVAFEPNDDNLGWGYYTASSVADHQQKAAGMVKGYCRIANVGFNDSSTAFVALWHDTQVGGWIAEHDLTSAEYQQHTTNYNNQYGYYPISVQASGSGNSARFAAVWAATDLPQARQWSTSGQQVPALASFDTWVQNWMQSTGTRAATLAIAKDKKLVLARGYTWAEPGYPQTQPTSLFRIASCTKPLTSIAIHQEIQQAPQWIDYDSTMVSYFNNPQVFDNRTNTITIRDLLTHQGGWDRTTETGTGIDPMFYDPQISQAQSVSIPIAISDIRDWVMSQQLDFTPGLATHVYSNYGFSLLGRILERRNGGVPYAQIMQNQVFGPLGITRAVIGGPYREDALPGEVRYHPQRLSVSRSVNEVDRPFVPWHYGGFNMANLDSHGAYVMTAPDYAKVLAAFDLGLFNPLLGPTQRDRMWSANPQPGADPKYRKGWMRNIVTVNGNTTNMYEHGGVLPGTRTYIAHRPIDGVSFVLFANGDGDLGNPQGQELSDLANTVSAWPQQDLFGSVGLPSFHQIDDIMAPYGSGCPGSTGQAYAAASGSADIGARLSMDLIGAPPGAPALCLAGYSRLALDCGFLGAPGCTLLTDPALQWIVVANARGSASQLADVPADPQLVGLHVYMQFGIADAAANAFGVSATNGVDITIGGWLGQ